MDEEEKEEKKAEEPAQPKNQEEDWAKKLGADPADKYYEDSPEIARIEEALPAVGNTAVRPAKAESLEGLINKVRCIHLTQEMILESINGKPDSLCCPVKVALDGAKSAFESSLTETEEKMEVILSYLPCHLCLKHYQIGKELSKRYKLRRDQIEFLKEFDLLEERPVSSPKYLDKTNWSRGKTARRLERRKLLRTAERLLGNPKNPEKPEETLIANLSLLGYIASSKDPKATEERILAILIPTEDLLDFYIRRLKTRIERLKEFTKTRKPQRTNMGGRITSGVIELEHQFKLLAKHYTPKKGSDLPQEESI